MPSNYPSSMDDFPTIAPSDKLNATGKEHSSLHTNLGDAVEKVQQELGVTPKGSFGTVRARLENIEGTFGTNTVTATRISDSTSLGRSVLTAATQADARTALGVGTSGTIATARVGRVLVASSASPQAMKDAADYVCDGTDDQAEINQALIKATRPGDGFGGEGYIGVQLVGPTFNVGNNNSTVITMYPNTVLWGNGPGTLLRPMFTSGSTKAVIESLNLNVSRCEIRNLSIGTVDDSLANGNGIHLSMTGTSGSTYEIKTTYNYPTIRDVMITKLAGKGIWLENVRESLVSHCVAHKTVGEGIHVDGGFDSKIFDCVATGSNGRAPGIKINGVNSIVSNCKVYDRGNEVGGSSEAGFDIGNRVRIENCSAQGNAGFGFYMNANDITASNLTADSNSSQATKASANGGAFYIGGRGAFSNLHAFDRAVNTQTQSRGVALVSLPQVYLTGRISLPSGFATADFVIGTPGTGSYARMIRDQDALYTFA